MDMKLSKTIALVLVTTITSFAMAQSNTSTADVAKDDRAYVSDYADKKANVVYLVEGKENPATFKEILGKSVVFADSTGSNMTIEHGSATFKFALKIDASAWKKACISADRGDAEGAIKVMRDIVYPVIPLVALSRDAFDSAEYIEPFVSALLDAKRFKEAYAFAMALPIDLACADVIKSAMKVAVALSENGENAKALKIVEKVELRDDVQFAASDSVLKAMSALRNNKMLKELQPMYAKFGATKNPQADEFKLWGVYCDVTLGNRMSAELMLGTLKIDKKSEEFSLLQLIKGDMRISDPKKPDIMGALDNYAEGIVFGKVSSDWMPELLYKTGIAYKSMKKFVASNEIFAQISAMYPNDSYAAKGAKEIVKIEKKKVKAEVSHDDDDDEDEDE